MPNVDLRKYYESLLNHIINVLIAYFLKIFLFAHTLRYYESLSVF